MLWRPRTLPKPLSKSLATPTSAPAPAPASAAVGAARPPVAVVIPARNEAHIIGGLLDGLGAQRRAGDQIVVVDDHSTDGTAQVAKEHGAVVIDAPDLPAGWAGKPHACHVGAVATTAPVLVFVDADVTPGAALLDAVAFALAQSPDALVSVQPWHRPGSGVRHGFEQFSVVFNVVALMGSGAFSALGARRAGRVAFGPVLACGRDRYVAVGGHAADDVRAAILEDIALARKFGQRELFVGSAADTSFRMYPGGRRAVIEGWTKGIAIGADAAPWWSTAATAAWGRVAGRWMAGVVLVRRGDRRAVGRAGPSRRTIRAVGRGAASTGHAAVRGRGGAQPACTSAGPRGHMARSPAATRSGHQLTPSHTTSGVRRRTNQAIDESGSGGPSGRCPVGRSSG